MTTSQTNIQPAALRRIKLPPIITGLLAATLAALIGTFALAIIFCHTGLSPATAHALRLPLLGLCALIGAFAAARAAARKGLVQGLRLGALLLVLLLAFTLAGGTISPVALIIKAAIILLCAALGGILGVF